MTAVRTLAWILCPVALGWVVGVNGPRWGWSFTKACVVGTILGTLIGWAIWFGLR